MMETVKLLYLIQSLLSLSCNTNIDIGTVRCFLLSDFTPWCQIMSRHSNMYIELLHALILGRTAKGHWIRDDVRAR